MNRNPDRDTTIADIHAIRANISEQFGGDIDSILADARERQSKSGRAIWQGPRKEQRPQNGKLDQQQTRLSLSSDAPSPVAPLPPCSPRRT